MEHYVSKNVCDELDFNSQCPDASSNDNIPSNTINVEEPDPINVLLLENQFKEAKIGSSIFRCEICYEEVFKNENLLKEHLKSHSYQHTCYICDAKFKITLDYIQHRQTHNKHKPYRCTLCTFTNRFLYKMSSHLQAKHEQFKKYKCDVCYSRFHVSTHYMEHILSFHNGGKPFKCKICSKTFIYSRDLNSHVQLKHVTGTFECPKCKEEFEFKGDLSQHIKKHKKQPCLCQVCGKILSGPDKLKNHSRIHTGDKPYNCKFCEKSFPTCTRLSEHENIHKRIKPYKCNQCEKSFSQPTPLKIHIRSQHTTERPFKCWCCGEGFVAKNLLNHHQKSCYIKLYNATPKLRRKKSQKKYRNNKQQRCVKEPKGNPNLVIDQNQLNVPDSMNTQLSHLLRNCNGETDNVPPQNNNGDSSNYVVPPDLMQRWYTLYQKRTTDQTIDQNQLTDPDPMNTKNSHFSGNCNIETDKVPPQNNNGDSSNYVVPPDLMQRWYTLYQKRTADQTIDQNQLTDPDPMNTKNSHSSGNCNGETDNFPPQKNIGESSSCVIPPDLQTWWNYNQKLQEDKVSLQ